MKQTQKIQDLLTEGTLEDSIKAELLQLLPQMTPDQKHTLETMLTQMKRELQNVEHKSHQQKEHIFQEFSKTVETFFKKKKKESNIVREKASQQAEEREIENMFKQL
jgi:hypothetical protein